LVIILVSKFLLYKLSTTMLTMICSHWWYLTWWRWTDCFGQPQTTTDHQYWRKTKVTRFDRMEQLVEYWLNYYH
jgi:hypothetical protein